MLFHHPVAHENVLQPWFQIRPLFRKRKAVEVTAVRALRKRLDLVARGRRGSARRGFKGFLASVFFFTRAPRTCGGEGRGGQGTGGIASLLHPFVPSSFSLPSRCARAFGRGPHEWRAAAVRRRAERLERTVGGGPRRCSEVSRDSNIQTRIERFPGPGSRADARSGQATLSTSHLGEDERVWASSPPRSHKVVRTWKAVKRRRKFAKASRGQVA